MAARRSFRFLAHAAVTFVSIFALGRSARAETPGSASADPPASARAVRLDFDPRKPVPAGYHVKSTPSWLVIPGALLFGLSYAAALDWSIAGAASPKCPYDRWMALPIAGPFVTAANYDNVRNPQVCDDSDGVLRPLAWMDGIAQIGGALLLAGGVLHPSRTLVRDDVGAAGTRSMGTTASVTWQVAPVALGKTGGAVVVLGTF